MTLRTYVIKRVLLVVPSLFITSLLIFSIIYLAPGNPVELFLMDNPEGYRKEIREELEHQLGLDRPIYIQYLDWVTNFFRGDFGRSITSGVPVSEAISVRLGNTLQLTLIGFILSLLISIPMGVLSAIKRNSIVDNLIRSFGIFFYCSPAYLTGLIFLLIFSLRLGWFPSFGASSMNPKNFLLDRIRHMILPTAVLVFGGVAFQMRLVRSSMLEVLESDYIKTARAKGLKEYIVIYKHALRNALLPVITLIGMNISFLFAGAALTETVFSWPGMGKFAVQMAFRRDYPTLMGINMIVASLVLLGNLIADISYAFLDPRIRY